MNASYRSSDVMVRSDVGLAFEELLLQHGPELFVVMLKKEDKKKREWVVRYASSLLHA